MKLFDLCIFTIGIIIGSFLNVCIFRIPRREDIVYQRSRCPYCGRTLTWHELIPVASFVIQKGKCRGCGRKLSWQYPLIELANGCAYLLLVHVVGISPVSILYGLCVSALLVLAVIDFRTYEIPLGCNLFIGALGLIRLFLDLSNWQDYAAGFFAVSGIFVVLYFLTKGKGIGGGDIKLMAAAGLLLGWKLAIIGFLLGCILGSVIHVVRMRLSSAEHVLAMGPYLSAGIFIAALWGDRMLAWYLSLY